MRATEALTGTYGNESNECQLLLKEKRPKILYDSVLTTSTHNKRELESTRPPLYVYLVAGCAALNSFNVGFDIGVNSPAGVLVQKYFELKNVELEAFMGAINFFALFGAILSSKLVSQCGMLNSFILSSAVFVVGVLIMSFSSSYDVLMSGRILVGLGVGFGFAITPIYLAEISPKSHRGSFVSWSEIGCNVGILVGFATGFLTYAFPDNLCWRLMFAVGGVTPVVVACLAWSGFMVESPRWLVSKGRDHEALQVLSCLHPEGYDVSNVMVDIKMDMAQENHLDKSGGSIWSFLIQRQSPATKRMLLVGLVVATFHEMCGVDAIQYYLVFIMNASGITGQFEQAKLLLLLGALKLSCLFVVSSLIDKLGRRPLMFVSLIGMALSLLTIAYEFYASEEESHSIFIIGGLAIYLASFSLGLGPLGWVIPPELFSTTIRSKAVSLTTFANRFTATLMTSTMLSLANLLGWGGYFLLLASICLSSLIFSIFYLPETKGKQLEEMTAYFACVTNDKVTLSYLSSWAEGQQNINDARSAENV